ncbi:MAG: energy transducer TonB [Bacteroidetes bacterium]|nr:energy transducer TonB [Bacteroidota bacterium]
MSKKPRKQNFIQLPKVTGGRKTFATFLQEHMVYPHEALQHGIEGNVLVEYEVDDNGIVFDARVIKGLGYGLDEEALRLIRLLRFEKVKNRGMRLRSKGKTNIPFRLPASMVYSVVPSDKNKPSDNQNTTKSNTGSQGTITYTIEF